MATGGPKKPQGHLCRTLGAHFAYSRAMLLLEVFQTTHPNFDVFSVDWALYFAIGDDKAFSLVFLRAR